jgi:ABC-type bacteriocin/lantibiotic exporter with double-glycine peptidase domain
MKLMPHRTATKPAVLMVLTLLICCFASCENNQSAKVVSSEQIKGDLSCGPECLVAFMKLTGAGRPDCDIECIYKLIGKEPFSDTTLKDLKDAAQKLGLSANGYKLAVDELTKINGYAILPVGSAAGTADDPLHFILVKQVVKDDVTIINTRTLQTQTVEVSDLQNAWKGYALVISQGNGLNPQTVER